MPSVFFLSPFQPPIWKDETKPKIDVEKYTREISKRWPRASIVINLESETYVASWDSVSRDDSFISGGLQKGQQVVSCEGTAQGIAEFVVWHKHYVSSDDPLFFFDDGLHINLSISTETSEAEIIGLIHVT